MTTLRLDNLQKEMPRLINRDTPQVGQISLSFVAYSGSAKDLTENASTTTALVASVVTTILSEARIVTLHEAVAESLRRRAPIVMRPLWAVALPALSITGSSVYTI